MYHVFIDPKAFHLSSILLSTWNLLGSGDYSKRGVARLHSSTIKDVAKAEISSILCFAAGSATFNAKTDHDRTEGILYAVLAHPQKSKLLLETPVYVRDTALSL